MINGGKCPGCGNVATSIAMETISGRVGIVSRTTYNLVSYTCPSCHTILGVEMDPMALKADIVNDLVKKLRR